MPATAQTRPHAASAIVATITRCTVPLPTPPSAATFSMPFPALRCVLIAFSTSGATLGRPSFFACLAHTVEPGENPASEHRSFLLAKHRCHLDHGAAHRRRGIDSLLVAIQANAGRIQFSQGIATWSIATSKPIHRRDHQDVIATPHRVLQHWRLCSCHITFVIH